MTFDLIWCVELKAPQIDLQAFLLYCLSSVSYLWSSYKLPCILFATVG